MEKIPPKSVLHFGQFSNVCSLLPQIRAYLLKLKRGEEKAWCAGIGCLRCFLLKKETFCKFDVEGLGNNQSNWF